MVKIKGRGQYSARLPSEVLDELGDKKLSRIADEIASWR